MAKRVKPAERHFVMIELRSGSSNVVIPVDSLAAAEAAINELRVELIDGSIAVRAAQGLDAAFDHEYQLQLIVIPAANIAVITPHTMVEPRDE